MLAEGLFGSLSRDDVPEARRLLRNSVRDAGLTRGRLLLMELTERVTRPEGRYRHEWRVGDLVLWDNRRTLHRGLAFDERFVKQFGMLLSKAIDSARF